MRIVFPHYPHYRNCGKFLTRFFQSFGKEKKKKSKRKKGKKRKKKGSQKVHKI
jgi:hypothetical protein